MDQRVRRGGDGTRQLARRVLLRVAGCCVAGYSWIASPLAHADEARTMALGRHLSRECNACHRLDGVDNGIPSITGWPRDDFVATMEFYRNGARPNAAMVSVAQSLADDEIAALAAYYASLPKPARHR